MSNGSATISSPEQKSLINILFPPEFDGKIAVSKDGNREYFSLGDAIMRAGNADQVSLITYDEVRKAWPTDKPPGERRLRGMLNAGSNRGEWLRQGMGTKGGPYRYLWPEPGGSDSFPVAPPLGGEGRETNTDGQMTLDSSPPGDASGQDSSHGDVQSGAESRLGA